MVRDEAEQVLAALAGPPEAPWRFADIGEPQAAGSTDVDANGVWTVKGSGDDVWGFADSFQLAYQPVKGDGSITARLLSRSGGNGEWAKTGLMIRDSSSNGAPNVYFAMTPSNGLIQSARFMADEGTGVTGEVGRRPQRDRQWAAPPPDRLRATDLVGDPRRTLADPERLRRAGHAAQRRIARTVRKA